MKGQDNFSIYKKIKEDIKSEYKGYPIEKIIALDLIIKVYVKRKYNVKTFISFILKHTLPVYFSSRDVKQLAKHAPTSTLFSIGMYGRKDYYEIWKFAQRNVKKKETFDFSKQKVVRRINVKNIIRGWKIISKTKRLNLLEKFWLAAKITYYLNIIDDLEKLNPIFGKYCAFSSTHEHEALLTYYFKKRNVETYSLQHGLFTVYKKDIPLDAILYENFNADHHLCWGKATKDDFSEIGIKKDALTVAGYSRAINRPETPVERNEKECLVLLGRYAYNDSNFRLIGLLKKFSKKYGVQFHFKLHPSLYWPQYYSQYKEVVDKNGWEIISKEETLNETFKDNKYGWSIAVNTSAYYEAYIQYLPCLRFNDGSFENMVDIMNDVFTNYEQLIVRFKNIPFHNQAELKEYFIEVDKNLDYAIGINTNKYDCLNV